MTDCTPPPPSRTGGEQLGRRDRTGEGQESLGDADGAAWQMEVRIGGSVLTFLSYNGLEILILVRLGFS